MIPGDKPLFLGSTTSRRGAAAQPAGLRQTINGPNVVLTVIQSPEPASNPGLIGRSLPSPPAVSGQD